MSAETARREGELFRFAVSDAWRETYPDAHAGVLVMHGAVNPAALPTLEKRRSDLEEELRARFSGHDRAALQANPILRAYEAYYRRFKKTYHVQLQLESILFKGKSIPKVAPLVEGMFMAEMDSLLLTAGHDLDAVRSPVTLDVAKGTESYFLLRGEAQVPKAGDMMITDGDGVISSIVYGPDQRTQITAHTRNALFTVYAPTGVGEQVVEHHLSQIRDNVLVVAPDAQIELLKVYGAR